MNILDIHHLLESSIFHTFFQIIYFLASTLFCVVFFWFVILLSLIVVVNFHVEGWPNFTILIHESNRVHITEQCLCVMFRFQQGFLHISKDLIYDANNYVSSSLYMFLTFTTQGT
jgi:hypothetical protein